jgi:transposase
MVTWFLYAARRVDCPEHGVVVEHLPWSEGKRPVTLAMIGFLARWARRLSWRETARAFGTSWECVYRSVDWYVQWGLAHRKLEGVKSIGVDDLHWGQSKGANSFLTVIYQIDTHCRRLLWVGKKRTQATLRRGLAELGAEVVGGLRFVCSDPVAALLERDRRQGRPGVACAGPFPYHDAFEPGGGSGAARREHPTARPPDGRATQENALETAAQRQPGARPGQA